MFYVFKYIFGKKYQLINSATYLFIVVSSCFILIVSVNLL